jgi:2,3-bisphosphoglycerate-dependent phosphoglycerate mutase
VLVAAHGNSLRSIIKELDGLSNEEVINLELARLSMMAIA